MTQTRRDYKTRFQSQGVGISSKQQPVSVMLPPEIDAIVRSLPNRSEKIRQWIIEGLQREELYPAQESHSSSSSEGTEKSKNATEIGLSS